MKICDKCNLKCTYCYNQDIRTHNECLSSIDWIKIVDQILPHSDYIVLTGGEPFLYGELGFLIKYIRSKKQNVFMEIISNGMSDFVHGQYNEIFERIRKKSRGSF